MIRSLEDYRQAARGRFASLGFPSSRMEGWRKTSVSSIAKMPLKPVVARPLNTSRVESLVPVSGRRMAFQAGAMDPMLSHLGSTGSLNVITLATAARGENQAFFEWLRVFANERKSGPQAMNAFAALNGSALNDGAFIVAGASSVNDLIQVVHVTDGESGQGSYPRTILIAEPRSDVTLVEVFAGESEKAFLNSPFTEILVGEDARVAYCRINLDASSSSHFGNVKVVQRARSRFVAHLFSTGAHLSRVDVNLFQTGANSKSDLSGLVFLQGTQHADYQIRVEHGSDGGVSAQKFHAIADDQSRSIFTGRVVVEKGAVGNDARQNSRSLLLSEQASACSEPQLEIHADEVRCTHGSATGQLEKDALFYLRSRGLDEAAARGILVEAFACDALSEIADSRIRDFLAGKVRKWGSQ